MSAMMPARQVVELPFGSSALVLTFVGHLLQVLSTHKHQNRPERREWRSLTKLEALFEEKNVSRTEKRLYSWVLGEIFCIQ
jgi:hypothetical protein